MCDWWLPSWVVPSLSQKVLLEQAQQEEPSFPGTPEGDMVPSPPSVLTFSCPVPLPSGEKPFECKLCHQRSRDYSAMIKHLRTHNGASPYQCTICTEYCPSLSSMQKHMKGHKPEEIPPDWRIEKTYLYLCYV